MHYQAVLAQLIYVNNKDTTYKSIDGVLYSKYGTKPLNYPK